MKQVTLKSKVGPTGFTVRKKIYAPDGVTFGYDRLRVTFDLDNDCRQTIPSESWEEIKEMSMDSSTNFKYKDAFIEL